MTTLISGQLGKAARIRGDALTLIDVNDKVASIEASFSSLRPLFAAAEDLIVSPLTSESRIRDALRTEWQKDRGLLLTLMTIDADLDIELRDETVPLANELLESDAVARFVLYMLHAQPIDAAVLSERIIRAPESSPLHSILMRTIANRTALDKVAYRWQVLDDGLFSSDASRKEMRATCVRAGVFYHLANALRSNSAMDLNTARFDATISLQVHPRSREIIAQWFGPLKTGVSTKQTRQSNKMETEEEIHAEEFGKDVKLKPHERYRWVQSQLPSIRKSMQKLRMDAVRQYTNQIIGQQIEQGDEEFAAKTLCNVASFANDCFQFSYALELIQRATQLYSVDPIAWAMLADANIRLNRYDEAVTAFNECRRYGREHYASNGIGRILRHQNRLVEAKAEFEKIVDLYQHDAEVWNTYLVLGELYRDLGEYDAASTLYEKAIKEFPEQSMLLCGKAALLREVGRLNESIETYRTSFELHGITVGGSIGLAESLRDVGDSKAAYQIVDSGAKRFPEESALHRAKAEALRSLGRHSEAISIYQFMETELAYDHSGLGGHIDTLLELGRFGEALTRARAASSAFPNEPILRLKEVLVLQKTGNREAALGLLGVLSTQLPTHVGVKIGTAEILKQLGNLNEAKSLYEKLVEETPYFEALRVSSAAISVATGDFVRALGMLRPFPPRTQTEWVGEHVRGMALLKQGHIGAALKVFETGSKDAPFIRQRGYFQTALLLAQLKARQIEEADPETILGDDPIGNVIKLHIYAIKNQVDRARASLSALQNCPPNIVPLRDELAAQMNLSKRRPQHDADWIFAQEVAVLALVPTYDLAA